MRHLSHAALLAVVLAAAPPDASAALGARARLTTVTGGARVVVSVTGATTVPRRSRPIAVSVIVGKTTLKLTRSGRRWRSVILTGTRLARVQARTGTRITVRLRSRTGVRVVRPRLTPPPTQTPPPTPGPAPAPLPGTPLPTGTWYYLTAGKAARFVLATQAETQVELAPDSKGLLGFGGGVFTDVRAPGYSDPTFTLNLHEIGPVFFSLRSAFPNLQLPLSGYVSGRVQPNPSGTLFALPSRESAGLGEPFVDYVTMFDQGLEVVTRVAGYRQPAWIDDTHVVYAGADGLFVDRPGAATPPIRIGPVALGVPNSPPTAPAVSPDRTTIAFEQADIIWRIGVDGSGLTALTRQRLDVGWPMWSPDGTMLTVIPGVCPVSGTTTPSPDVAIISATATAQDVDRAPKAMRSIGVPVRTCGPVYWLE